MQSLLERKSYAFFVITVFPNKTSIEKNKEITEKKYLFIFIYEFTLKSRLADFLE